MGLKCPHFFIALGRAKPLKKCSKPLDNQAQMCYTIIVKGREALRNNLVETENSSKKNVKNPLTTQHRCAIL